MPGTGHYGCPSPTRPPPASLGVALSASATGGLPLWAVPS